LALQNIRWGQASLIGAREDCEQQVGFGDVQAPARATLPERKAPRFGLVGAQLPSDKLEPTGQHTRRPDARRAVDHPQGACKADQPE
jgi:hypothetical protein